MNRVRLISLPVVALLLLLTPNALADDDDIRIVAPNHSFKGLTQAELANHWWQWALSFPAPVNPLLDTTGEFSYLGDLGPIFFLGATTGNQTVARTVTIGSTAPVIPTLSSLSPNGVTACGKP